MQLALRLERLTGGLSLPRSTRREQRRRDARVFAGPRIEVGAPSEVEIPGPAGPIGARLYVPAGSPSRRR